VVAIDLRRRLRDVPIDQTIMNEPGKMLFIIGLMIAAVGLLIWSGFGKGWLGRLPGDIHYTKGNFSLHFSVVLTFLLWLFRK
jgi:membrane protein implicated in regulation of membrane protease activity